MKLTENEIDFLLYTARENRENSASLAQVPGQQWKILHEKEVKMMDLLIEKLEAFKNTPAYESQSKRYELLVNGNISRSTSNKLTFQNYIQDVTEQINIGSMKPEDVWLREVCEAPITAFLENMESNNAAIYSPEKAE